MRMRQKSQHHCRCRFLGLASTSRDVISSPFIGVPGVYPVVTELPRRTERAAATSIALGATDVQSRGAPYLRNEDVRL